LIVNVVVRVAPPPVAVIVTAVEVVTELDVTENCAVVAPDNTVTVPGIEATAAFELERLTRSPPLGAALLSVTVPVAALPPVTLDGDTLIADTLAGGGTGVTVRVAVRVVLPCVAVIATDVEVATELVAIAKLTLVAPDATVTLPGTDATVGFALERLTTTGLLPAALVRVTVPVAPLPPTTVVGLAATEDRPGADGAACGVTRRLLENGPAAPAASTPRTRQKSSCAGRPVIAACDTLTLSLRVSGAVKVLEVSI